MFGIGTTEILVILVVALLVLGPKKLPEIARSLGKTLAEFKRVSTDVKRTIDLEVQEEDEKERRARLKKKMESKAGKTEESSPKDEEASSRGPQPEPEPNPEEQAQGTSHEEDRPGKGHRESDNNEPRQDKEGNIRS
ncbi:TatA/E family twin arginine-targeting protein translocase [Desulfonatronospira sp.]|uniref:TatA/E family twin arginine-targeting protein translocase n=1 Tax=Desulfonatronospira sp. TaxID=1962951 RepID=UPI0025C5A21B|nr:TatA/E family twin arginine-targeting protein translocase [Desulfonatronospira sp.]